MYQVVQYDKNGYVKYIGTYDSYAMAEDKARKTKNSAIINCETGEIVASFNGGKVTYISCETFEVD